MKDVEAPDEVREVTAALRAFLDREVLPLEDAERAILDAERNRYLPDGRYHPDVLALRDKIRRRSAELGFYTLFGAEELGGAGLGAVAAAYIQEAVNRHVGPGHVLTDVVLPSPFTNGLTPVLKSLTQTARDEYLPQIAAGEKTLCFALSEPDAGSDVLSMKTRAVRSADGWLLTGTKQWITNAPYADYAMVFARTDRAVDGRTMITGFFVDTTTAGFDVPAVIPVMGHQGGEAGIVTLDNVFVPDSHVLGKVGGGLRVALGGVGTGRMSMAATCVGLARWALERSLEYAKQRVTFGKPIAEHQAIQLHLAEMAMDIYAAKTMVQDCAWRIDAGESPIRQVSSVKAFSTEMLYRVMDRAMHVHGAMGLSNELRIEEGLRFARALRVPDGTAEIQRRTIAKQLLAGDLDF